MKIFSMYKKAPNFFILIVGLISNIACGIDNPDSTDLIAEFNSRAKNHIFAVEDPKLGNRGVLLAYDNYQVFLDKELNKAYKLLRSKLASAQQKVLKKSQQSWIKYRDAEFELIQDNWTRKNFGSSAGRSRGTYRCNIIESRVKQLLYYAQNY